MYPKFLAGRAVAPLVVASWLLSFSAATADLVNRWSFNGTADQAVPSNTVFTDSISGAQARVKGVNAKFNAAGTALVLPGTSNGRVADASISAYIDLPNGIISSKANLTVEIWASPISGNVGNNYQRLFDFGRMRDADGDGLGAPGEWTGNGATAPAATQSSDDMMLTTNEAAGLNTQRQVMRLNGGTEILTQSALSTVAGTRYHYVLTFEDGVGNPGGGRVSWYRDGTLVGTKDIAFRMSDIEDVNNWLGRSQYSGDWNANVSYDEVRLYNHAMTAAEVAASGAAGSDPTVPVLQPDSVTMHSGQKALVPVLDNDTGNIDPSTVVIVQAPQFGQATVGASGKILYTNTSGTGDSFTYKVSGLGGESAPATVTIQITGDLRIANPPFNVPGTPPATAFQFVNAFPALTFTQPVFLTSPPADTQRLFVVEKGGIIKVISDVTAASPAASVFLDLAAALAARGQGETMYTTNESGFTGLAFHPNYAANRYFYVFYTVMKTDGSHYMRVSRFTTQAANPNAADLSSELVLLDQVDRHQDHQGGCLQFGPDGYLYISLGDEGTDNDGYDNSQYITKNFFSGLLRIDVDKKPGSLAPNPHPSIVTDSGVARYAIPADNPFVHTSLGGEWNGIFNGAAIANLATVRTEFWAVGLRNPFRFTFDGPTGELWLGDVGQAQYEELNLITKGGNYGWVYKEGTATGPGSKAANPPAGFTSIPPVFQAPRGTGGPMDGRAIVGGVFYRGSKPSLAGLLGVYVFADYLYGNVWTMTPNGTGSPAIERITAQAGITSFGYDPSNQDILVTNLTSGVIQRLTSATVTDSFPQTLSETGLFADLTDLSPNPGLLPYSPNLAFWSDHAIKRRWFAMPDSTSQMTWQRDDPWAFPTGMVWVKHFDIETTPGNPATKKRLETRLLVKTDDGAYGVSYRWNDAGTEAILAPDEGVAFPVTITENGTPRVQTWEIPSRSNCLVCHTPQGGHALSFTTRQLNQVQDINGFTGNQLDLLQAAGYFSNTPDAPSTLPRHIRPDETAYPLEDRVRSYLAVNCAYCHQPGGSGPSWDGRPELTLEETGLINGTLSNDGGDPANKLVVPGDIAHSVLLSRIAASNGFTRMPPIATRELDQTSIELVQNWILALAEPTPTPTPTPTPGPTATPVPSKIKFGAKATARLKGSNILQVSGTVRSAYPIKKATIRVAGKTFKARVNNTRWLAKLPISKVSNTGKLRIQVIVVDQNGKRSTKTYILQLPRDLRKLRALQSGSTPLSQASWLDSTKRTTQRIIARRAILAVHNPAAAKSWNPSTHPIPPFEFANLSRLSSTTDSPAF